MTTAPSNVPCENRTVPSSDDSVAEQLRGFGPLGVFAILIIVLADALIKPLSAILVLLWARRSGTPWREIGYQQPRRCIGSLDTGAIFGVSFKLLLKADVMPMCARAAFDLTALGIIYWNLETHVARLLFKG